MAITQNGTPGSGNSGGAGAYTCTISSLTVPSGSNQILLVGIGFGYKGSGNVTPDSVVFNTSESCTKLGDYNLGLYSGVSLWYLKNPTATTADVVAGWSDSFRTAMVAAVFSGVHQTTPFGTPAGNTGTGTTAATVDVGSASGEVVVDVVGAVRYNSATQPTQGAGQTFLAWNQSSVDDSTAAMAAMSYEAGATTTTMSWTLADAGDDWSSYGVALKPAATSGTTFYLLSTATGDGWGDVQAGGSAPATATTGTGWTVGTTASANYSKMAFGTERAAGTFSGTAVPGTAPDNSLKDAIRIGPLSGSYAAGNWTFSVPVIAVTQQGGADGRIRVRVFRSANADGSSPSELTAGAVQGTIVTDLTTATAQNSTGTITLSAINGLNSEYLFFCFAWEITGAAA